MHVHIDRVFTTVSRNLGLEDFTRHTDSWIEWAYEAEKLIGSKDTFIQKEATYDSTGAKATGTITFAANPTSGDSIALNGTTLYFKDDASLGGGYHPNEIEIGSTLAATLTRTTSNTDYGLIQSLQGFLDPSVSPMTGVLLDTSSVLHYPETLNTATYSVDSSTGVLTVTAKEIGPNGNDYTLASDNANAKVSGLSLTGGKGIYRNQQITLPEDNIKLLGVRVGTDDSDYEHVELRKTSAVHRGRVGKKTDDSEQRAFRYYVDGNRLNIQHDSLDEITIVYLAYPKDARGWPMIKEGHETAVAQYIMWQMKLIEFYNGKLPQYITKDLEKRWYFLCGKARGDDSMPTTEELKQIGNMWNTLVPITNDRGTGLIDL
tara:strand:+ start:97 stop:1221 length:1125 start_codon:yes stop_codon:yes gene_type:complete